MNILFVGSSASWHNDLWLKYFVKGHSVYLFSDKGDYLKRQLFEKVTIIESEGYLGKILNLLKIKSHFLYQINISANTLGLDSLTAQSILPLLILSSKEKLSRFSLIKVTASILIRQMT